MEGFEKLQDLLLTRACRLFRLATYAGLVGVIVGQRIAKAGLRAGRVEQQLRFD